MGCFFQILWFSQNTITWNLSSGRAENWNKDFCKILCNLVHLVGHNFRIQWKYATMWTSSYAKKKLWPRLVFIYWCFDSLTLRSVFPVKCWEYCNKAQCCIKSEAQTGECGRLNSGWVAILISDGFLKFLLKASC